MKKYYRMSPEDIEKLQQELLELKAAIRKYQPKDYWGEASQSLVMRLRGIYPIGPDALTGIGEFGYRVDSNRPPIQYEAAQRIHELEEQLHRLQAEYTALSSAYLNASSKRQGP